jgi:CRP-like cAMP-binding protein
MNRALRPEDVADLGHCHLFSGMEPGALQRVAASARCLTFEDGERLFHFGDPAHRFYLVREGRVALSRSSPAGDEKIVDIIQPGQTFAEALMFMGSPVYPVTATALGVVQVFAFDNNTFMELLGDSNALCFRLLGNLSLRLHQLLFEIESLSLQGARSRLVNFLLSLLPEGSTSPAMVTLPAQKQVIASRLSITPETFSRLMHDLQEAGLVVIDGGTVTVRDIKGLGHFGQR